jgi:hypothetical protein
MTDYDGLLTAVTEHLAGLGIEVVIEERGGPVDDAALFAAEKTLGFALPDELVAFYRTMGDGIDFYWESDENDETPPAGGLEVLPLEHLVQHHLWVVEFYIDSKRDDDYPFVDDPEHERAVAEKKRRWLDFHEQMSRYTLAIDCNDPAAPVINNDHLWWSSQTSADAQGRLVAADFGSYYRGQASVCFQDPRSNFDVLTPAGLDWNGGEFSPDYRLP